MLLPWCSKGIIFYVHIRLMAYLNFRTGVNFINVKWANFSYEHCILAAFFSYMYVEKRCSYEKFARLTLMKLTPGE